MWMVPPALGWRRKPRNPTNRLILSLLGGVAVLFTLSLAVAWISNPITDTHWQLILQGTLLLAACALLIVTAHLVRRDLLLPLTHLRHWALRMRGGNLTARIPLPVRGEFVELARDMNDLGDSVHSLSHDMEAMVRKEMNRAEQKNRSLQILYDVAASMNVSRDLDDLLTRFLHSLKDVVNARGAAVRLLNDDGQMHLLMSIGLTSEAAEREQVLPSQQCMCGRAAQQGTVHFKENLQECEKLAGASFFNGGDVGLIAVPLQYRGRTLGIYNLFVDREQMPQDEDMIDLLTSVGRHLGMAIEKARMDEEAQRITVMEERTRLAHELHDSLAQSLASLRFQVRVLDETLHRNEEAALWQELEQIENSLDEANKELRTLIEHFRAPAGPHGLVPAIEQLVERFRNDTSIQIFLQKEWRNEQLPEAMQMEMIRIIQEALCNVRKHSQAHTVRVMMRNNEQGHCSVLIEDDGTGIVKRPRKSSAGEHIGLSIMEERAKRLGGELRIESEPGEGTRVMLTFQIPAPAANGVSALQRMTSNG
ncbi:MAG: GAF domain-containing protein [Gammaproteobacteria bacterium]